MYVDESVLLTHGGVEMGQGLHTKMIQIASTAPKIDPSKIHITETATDKVPNTSPSAASVSSDLYGIAILNACEKIRKRLEPYKSANPKATWKAWVKAAYLDRVSLSASGFYKVPDIGYNWETTTGNAYRYYTYGVGCSSVEIDCLTGDHQLLKTDIAMDLGESLNPAIDIEIKKQYFDPLQTHKYHTHIQTLCLMMGEVSLETSPKNIMIQDMINSKTV